MFRKYEIVHLKKEERERSTRKIYASLTKYGDLWIVCKIRFCVTVTWLPGFHIFNILEVSAKHLTICRTLVEIEKKKKCRRDQIFIDI